MLPEELWLCPNLEKEKKKDMGWRWLEEAQWGVECVCACVSVWVVVMGVLVGGMMEKDVVVGGQSSWVRGGRRGLGRKTDEVEREL